jgi:hypothetical protein
MAPCRITAKVYACAHEFEVVYPRTVDDFEYVLTPDTQGIDLLALREGDTVECVIVAGLPRVLSATLPPLSGTAEWLPPVMHRHGKRLAAACMLTKTQDRCRDCVGG